VQAASTQAAEQRQLAESASALEQERERANVLACDLALRVRSRRVQGSYRRFDVSGRAAASTQLRSSGKLAEKRQRELEQERERANVRLRSGGCASGSMTGSRLVLPLRRLRPCNRFDAGCGAAATG
jgi:hypothetical protein